MNFLGKDGLSYFWGKLKTYINEKVDKVVKSSDSSITDFKQVTREEYYQMQQEGTLAANTAYDISDKIFQIGTDTPIGSGCLWFGQINSIPFNYLPMDGRELDKIDYPDLFNIIGYTYGGSGNKFNLPNVAGRVIIHPDGSTGFESLGDLGGSKTTALTLANIPSHNHTIGSHAHSINSHSHTTPSHAHSFSGNTGGGGAHQHNVTGYPSAGGTAYRLTGGVSGASNGVWGSSQGNILLGWAEPIGDHVHYYSGTTSSNNGGNTGGASLTTNSAGSGNTGATGSGESFSNLQPYIVAYYIIKVKKDPYTSNLENLNGTVLLLQQKIAQLEASIADVSHWENK